MTWVATLLCLTVWTASSAAADLPARDPHWIPDAGAAADSTAWIDAEEAVKDVPRVVDLSPSMPVGGPTGSQPLPLPQRKSGPVRPGSRFDGSLPYITAFGVYAGYPSAAGAQVMTPADGNVALRVGLTAFPGIGYLWTPGVEIRFDQLPYAWSRDGVYGYANLAIGRMWSGSRREHFGMESGVGYRWFIADRRLARWLAGVEAGARWDRESMFPDRPSLRVYWMYADR